MKYKDEIILNNISGIITEIEEVEYQKFNLTIEIKGKIYKGIYIEYTKKKKIKKGDQIILFSINLVKCDRNIYIYSDINVKNISKNKNKECYIIKEEEKNIIYDFNPQSLIKTMMIIDKSINYKSDIFIFKQNNKTYILISIRETDEYFIEKSLTNSKFTEFILKNEISENSLIYIENFLLKKEKNLEFNNMTLFNIVKLQYLDEYFKENLLKINNSIISNKNQYKDNDIFYYKLISNDNNKENCLLLKIIDITNEYVIGIDYLFNIYKIFRNNNKLEKVNDIYKIVLIKFYFQINEDSIYILNLCENSYVYVFENSFSDIFLNDLTVINFNFLDFIEPYESNYYNIIGFNNNNFSFKISKKIEYVILYKKNDLNYNYFPYSIKLINQYKKEIHCFKFLLYLGLLNKVNCFINYTGEGRYAYEYFYYNFSFNLPKFECIKLEDKNYFIENSDNFNSKARKRFIVVNYYDDKNTLIYKAKKAEIKNYKKEKSNKIDEAPQNKQNEEKEKKKNEENQIESNIVNNYNSNNNDDDLDLNIENLHDSLQFCFLYENNKGNLLGIYEIEEIDEIIPFKKKKYEPDLKYKIFYDFFNVMKDKNPDSNERNEYLEKLSKYNNSEIKDLVTNNNLDFSNINYENYIIYINLCLFYYMNKTINKEELLKIFAETFNLLIDSELVYYDRIRIMRFICEEHILISNENRKMHLLIIDKLVKNNSYKIAINYNKNMISNLEENSKLFIPFLQLDSYILYNYFINAYSYTLSLEPLIITKKHLLSSYDNFIFTTRQKQNNDYLTLAYQNKSNDVTVINDYGLFPTINNCDSDILKGNDYAVPISAELLHERNGHSKKIKKNNRKSSPLYFYKRRNYIKADKDYQKSDVEKEEKGEAGLLIEYFIRYKKKSLVKELKFNHIFGNIINNVNLFTKKNFKDLYQEINNLKGLKKQTMEHKLSNVGDLDENLIENKNEIIIEENINKKKNELTDQSLLYYENKYLLNGKFVYPDSIPVNYIPYNKLKDNKEIPFGLKEYIKKYKEAIIKGKNYHYGEKK